MGAGVYVAEGRKIWTFVLVFALLVLVVGVYLGFIKSSGYVKSTGVVVSLREQTVTDVDTGYTTYYYPTVSHTVDGKEYTGALDINVGSDSIGQEMKIQYDPDDPSKINSYSPGIVIYIFAVGIILAGVSVYKLITAKKENED